MMNHFIIFPRPLLTTAVCVLAACAAATAASLQPRASVTGAGVYLDEIVVDDSSPVPHVRVAPAPRLGQVLALSVKQVEASLASVGLSNLVGSGQVRVTRRLRLLDNEELKLMIASQLQRDFPALRGDIELRLARPWGPVEVPDEALTLKISELPPGGITSLFVCRIELGTTNETVGRWQLSIGAKVWRDVWLSRRPLVRGTPLFETDLVRERRDVLPMHELLADFSSPISLVEAADYIAPNTPLLARWVRPQPAIRRGQSAAALLIEGALSISMKVDVLEDGAPGQLVRVRNPQTRRELRGKVQSEGTIVVTL